MREGFHTNREGFLWKNSEKDWRIEKDWRGLLSLRHFYNITILHQKSINKTLFYIFCIHTEDPYFQKEENAKSV